MANMSKRILKLSDQLSNQIAAGEVVERPAAALKELVENSLDAGARTIRVQLKEGGIQMLEVADDGSGIHPQDLHLALDRHATSKIAKTEDLFAINSWGFRGEALASIGAVSRLTLSSRFHESDSGMEIITEGGRPISEKEIARPIGTTVKVEDLFYNTPARRKFLKNQGAETSACLQVMHRLALSSPEVSFEATVNGERALLYTKAEKMETRVVEVFREAWNLKIEEKDLMPIDAKSGDLRIRAWLLPSKFFIPSSRGILTFVNKRSVKDKLLQQSILSAAKEVLFGSLYPQMVLFLDMPNDGVDVNVHPTKAEVRFRDSGHVFAFVRKVLEKALAEDRRGSVDLFQTGIQTPHSHTNQLFETNVQYHQKDLPAFASHNISAANYSAIGTAPTSSNETILSPANTLEESLPQPRVQFLGTLKNTYLICQDEEGLLLVDQHAAHERVTYEKLRKQKFDNQPGVPLLIPIQVELAREALDRLENSLPRFAELGLIMDRTGPTVAVVRELPAILVKRDGSPAFSLGQFLRGLSTSWDETLDDSEFAELLKKKMLDVLATESCHGSVRAGQNLSPQQAFALLAQMSDTDFSGHCPHGRPTTVRLKWSEIERLFKRVF